jgi:hypothetical protein
LRELEIDFMIKPVDKGTKWINQIRGLINNVMNFNVFLKAKNFFNDLANRIFSKWSQLVLVSSNF